MFCKYCGAELPDGSKFCQYCGKKLDSPEVVQAAPPVQPAPAEPVVAAVAAAAEPVQQNIPPVEPAPSQEIYRQPAQPQYVPPVEPQQTANYQQAQPVQTDQPKKKSKKGLLIGLIAGGVALIALILVFIFAILPLITGGRKIEVDFKKYAKMEFEGYDTIGNAEADYDMKALLADIGEDLKFTREYKSLEKSYEPDEFLPDLIYYYVGDYDYGQLSNGDSVDFMLDVSPDVEEIFNIKIVDAESYSDYGEVAIPMTVEGLKEAELFDPFEGIEFELTGTSPFGALEFSLENGPEPSKEYYYAFEADKYYDLANGDVVTITMDDSYNEYFLSEYGMLPTKTTYEYTVEGLPEFVTDIAQISSADMDNLKSVVDNIYYNEYVSYDDESIKTTSYGMIGNILRVSNSMSEYGYDNNTIYCVCEQKCSVEVSGYDPQSFTVYGVISFDNLKLEDGVLVFDEYSWYEEPHEYSMDVGPWTISGHYGFGSINDVKTTFINSSDTYYTYQDNINK